MDVWRITVATLRRWYIFVPLLALTGWGVVTAGEGVDPEYEVGAVALIVPGVGESDVPNPYGGLDQANAAVSIVLNSVASRSQLAERGLTATYEASAQSRSGIMYLNVRGDDPGTAVATAEAVLELAREELFSRQDEAGIPAAMHYGLDVLDRPAVTQVTSDGKLQVQAVVAVLGAGLSLLVAVLFDDIVGLLRRGLARRRAARASDLPTDDFEAADPPAAAPQHADAAVPEAGEHERALDGTAPAGAPVRSEVPV